jgi:hypothetical protein
MFFLHKLFLWITKSATFLLQNQSNFVVSRNKDVEFFPGSYSKERKKRLLGPSYIFSLSPLIPF